MSGLFLHSFWFGLAAWTLLYLSDYALTLTCARMYRDKVSEHMRFEGSYEITPYFQSDIDALRKISPRFVGALLFSALLLGIVWTLSSEDLPELYAFALGAMILLQLAVHTRHLKNFFTFRGMNRENAVHGRIEYSRPFMLRISSAEMFVFAGFYLALCAFIPTWFLLGGVATCISTALKHRRLAQRAALVNRVAPNEAKA